MSNDPVRQVLLDAADLLERDGWCQHIGIDDGRHCAWAAMCKVRRDAASPALAAHRVELTLDGQMLASWNDDKRRTAKSVIRKLREVANA